MVGSQTNSLTLDLFLGHNLCFKYPNGSYEPILDIFVPRAFQWYKKLFKPMNFDLYNHPIKIRKYIETLIPKMGVHLGMWGFIPSHSLTLPRAQNVTLGIHLWPTPLQALALVTNLRLGLLRLGLLRLGLQQKSCYSSLNFNFRYSCCNFVINK